MLKHRVIKLEFRFKIKINIIDKKIMKINKRKYKKINQ